MSFSSQLTAASSSTERASVNLSSVLHCKLFRSRQGVVIQARLAQDAVLRVATLKSIKGFATPYQDRGKEPGPKRKISVYKKGGTNHTTHLVDVNAARVCAAAASGVPLPSAFTPLGNTACVRGRGRGDWNGWEGQRRTKERARQLRGRYVQGKPFNKRNNRGPRL
jgi:hypothetical protein